MEINDRFLRACRREAVDVTPVWFMRQAGRYMAEYRAIREKNSLLEICSQPELAAEVTLQPVRALGVDAAILFADILLPVIPLGLGLEFAKGEGPVIGKPVRTLEDVRAMRPVYPETDLGFVMEAIRILRGELNGLPLIGFCGAPFTVASYMIEGGSSREFLKTKTMMYSAPDVWHALMDKLSNVLAEYLVAQIREILTPLYSSVLCLRSRSESVIFCSVRKVAPVTSSTWVMASCSIRLWITSELLSTWFTSSVRLLSNPVESRVDMELNTIGLIAAASTFLGVWFGHVAVRKIEFISPTLWLPTGTFTIVGIILEWFSLSTASLSFSVLFGILGLTFLF